MDSRRRGNDVPRISLSVASAADFPAATMATVKRYNLTEADSMPQTLAHLSGGYFQESAPKSPRQ